MRSSSVGNMTTSPSRPSGGVAGDSPSATTANGWGLGATISARSVPRTQAVRGNGSSRAFSKPSACKRATAQAAACRSLAEPAGRGPKRVVSSLTHE